MAASTSGPKEPVTRADPGPGRSHLWAAVLGILGVGELLATWAYFKDHVTGPVPDHFGPTGTVNGSVSTAGLLTADVVLVALTSLMIFTLLAWTTRSAPLRLHHGSSFDRPLLTLLASIAVVSTPLTYAALLWNAAGGAPFSGGALFPTITLLGVVPVVVALLALLAGRGRGLPVRPDPLQRAGAAPVRFGVGPPIELQCAACGSTFTLAAFPLFAPHMAIRGRGSLYVRCARCSEVGWCAVVRRLA